MPRCLLSSWKHLKRENSVGHAPDHHRDPFDRMLVAQGQLEKLPILTGDPR